MRTLFFIIGITLCTMVQGQLRLNEKQVMKQKHIDFSTQVIYFELSGIIEIDGHIIQNPLNLCCRKVRIYYQTGIIPDIGLHSR